MRPEVEHLADGRVHVDGLLHFDAVLRIGKAEERREIEVGDRARKQRRTAQPRKEAAAQE